MSQQISSQERPENLPISDMRELHSEALREAESKRTELRLVLSSRYRDLVGSSDEVKKMEETSKELLRTLRKLPDCMEKLVNVIKMNVDEREKKEKKEEELMVLAVRQEISSLTRLSHRCIDDRDPERAARTLLRLFSIIRSQSSVYKVANELGSSNMIPKVDSDILLDAQIRMTYLQIERLPERVFKLAEEVLKKKTLDVEVSRGALCALSLLHPKESSTNLIDTYYDSKAKLINSLLELLKDSKDYFSRKQMMIEIVQALQDDVFLFSFELFIQEKNLPEFDAAIVKNKCSQFLSNHIPLIRSRFKETLLSISVSADNLGTIRQTLYDETNRVLNNPSWESALSSLVDPRVLSASLLSSSKDRSQRNTTSFNLWSVFFSSSFSSLVHDILTTSFTNIHSGIMETLRRSLANAPSEIHPHEAYHNTHVLVQQLDASLLKLSNDAHSLLIHNEERHESSLRLQQSLYVQTSEIMGRLLSELRCRMTDQQKVMLVIGRFAFLFHLSILQLSTLPKLLSESVPVTGSSRITLQDLLSSFQIADIDDDGNLSIEEAMEAMNMAFTGTTFNGQQMLKSALLLEDEYHQTHVNLTFLELALLSARGLRHEPSDHEHSALNMIQTSLEQIYKACFQKWSEMALHKFDTLFMEQMEHAQPQSTVSSHIIGYLLNAVVIFNATVCPADSLPPCIQNADVVVPSLCTVIRNAILKQSLHSIYHVYEKVLSSKDAPTDSFYRQIFIDISFVEYCYFQRNSFNHTACQQSHSLLNDLLNRVRSHLLQDTLDDTLPNISCCDLWLNTLFGEDSNASNQDILSDTIPTRNFLQPISSSKRFLCLPVQEVNRQLMELQLLRKNEFHKKDDAAVSSSANSDGKSWFGGFKSMKFYATEN